MIRPHSARSPAAASGELVDQQGRRDRVDGELLCPGTVADRRQGATESVPGPGCEAALDPAGGIVDQDVDMAQLLLGRVEQSRRGQRIAQVGSTAIAAPPSAVISATTCRASCRRRCRYVAGVPRVGGVLKAQVGAHDAHTSPRQTNGGGRTDPVVGTGHDRHVPAARHHDTNPFAGGPVRTCGCWPWYRRSYGRISAARRHLGRCHCTGLTAGAVQQYRSMLRGTTADGESSSTETLRLLGRGTRGPRAGLRAPSHNTADTSTAPQTSAGEPAGLGSEVGERIQALVDPYKNAHYRPLRAVIIEVDGRTMLEHYYPSALVRHAQRLLCDDERRRHTHRDRAVQRLLAQCRPDAGHAPGQTGHRADLRRRTRPGRGPSQAAGAGMTEPTWSPRPR
jgi:hypothetical protein